MTLRSMRPHIGIFGKRNVGKSSFINCLSSQDVAIVSPHAGTTTDPVRKTLEIFELGPVVLIDTAGIDDCGDVGEKRVNASKRIIRQVDLGIILITDNQFDAFEQMLVSQFSHYQVPFLVIHNKEDQIPLDLDFKTDTETKYHCRIVAFSSVQCPDDMFHDVVTAMRGLLQTTPLQTPSLFGDIVSDRDIVLLVTPIDAEAPVGRMILPQVQALRDALDHHCIVIVTRETELEYCFTHLKIRPKLVVTDSQAFALVAKVVPDDIFLTSFSIVLSRLKGDFNTFVEGTKHIAELKDGDHILILESCSHQVVDDDIGRVKLPKWMTAFTGKKLHFDIVAHQDMPPKEMREYALAIQCGGCMATRKQILNRIQIAADHDIPITNYGMAIAYLNGIFDRALRPFLENNETGCTTS